jgi:hypothetical protein
MSDFKLGGNMAGLKAGKSVVLVNNNGSDTLTVSSNGPFAFATKLATGTPYAVTVTTQPVGQTCTITAGGGTVAEADITGVRANCV